MLFYYDYQLYDKGTYCFIFCRKNLLKYNMQHLIVYKKLFYIQQNLIKSITSIKHCKAFLLWHATKHVHLLLIL